MSDNLESQADRFVESVVRYLDDELDDDATRQLNDTLRDDPIRRAEFIDYCIQSQLLREYGDCLSVVVSASRPKQNTTSRSGWKSPQTSWIVAIAGAVLLAFLLWPRSSANAPIASLAKVQGDVFLTRLGHEPQPVAPNQTARVGDTIVVRGRHSRAVLEYEDGTELRLVGDLSLSIEDVRKLRLNSGTLTASVTRQDVDHPLLLATPQATVRVLGTVFSVAAAEERTDVSVEEGRVRLTRTNDGSSVEVAQGEFAVANPQSRMTVQDIPRPPDTWSVDFEDRLPADWREGTFETQKLPADSRGAVRAERVQNDDGVFYQIKAPKKWSDGIFSIHDDTHLSFVFKLERPDWFQIFINTRPFDPDLPPTFLYRFRDGSLFQRSHHGRWLRATIPLTAFERVPERRGTPPLGEVPFELLFSAQGEDRGMIIDRMWVQRGGPGKIVIEELEP